MRLTQLTNQRDDTSSGWVERARAKVEGLTEDEPEGRSDRVREKVGSLTEDETKSWSERARAKMKGLTRDESGGWSDQGEGAARPDTEDASRGRFARARSKYGLGALLIVVGAFLVLFPEPVTSTAGFVLVGVGALIWLFSRLR